MNLKTTEKISAACLRLGSESWQSDGGNRTARRCFFSRGVSIMSSVRRAASSASLPNPTWAEARPICQAETISPEPSRNKLLSFPTVKALRGSRATGRQQRCYRFLMLHGEKEAEKGNIKHINLCRWCRWPGIALQRQQLYTELQREDKQRRKKRKKKWKRNIILVFLLSSLRESSFNKSPTLFLISSLCFTKIMTAVRPFPLGKNKMNFYNNTDTVEKVGNDQTPPTV